MCTSSCVRVSICTNDHVCGWKKDKGALDFWRIFHPPNQTTSGCTAPTISTMRAQVEIEIRTSVSFQHRNDMKVERFYKGVRTCWSPPSVPAWLSQPGRRQSKSGVRLREWIIVAPERGIQVPIFLPSLSTTALHGACSDQYEWVCCILRRHRRLETR